MTPEEARYHFNYEPFTGIVSWKIPTSNRVRAGSICANEYNGYLRVMFKGKRWYLHQIAWMIHKGILPAQIDHIDRNRSNNKWSNLRASNSSSNMKNKNKYKNNSTGICGISKTFRKSKGKFYYYAHIGINGKQKQLKCSVDIDKCIEARKLAEIQYGYDSTHGI